MDSWLVWTLAVIGIAIIIVPIFFAWVVIESRKGASMEQPTVATSKRLPKKLR